MTGRCRYIGLGQMFQTLKGRNSSTPTASRFSAWLANCHPSAKNVITPLQACVPRRNSMSHGNGVPITRPAFKRVLADCVAALEIPLRDERAKGSRAPSAAPGD